MRADNTTNNEDSKAAGGKKTRVNWGKSPHRERLLLALEEWSEKKGRALDPNGQPLADYKLFSAKVDIPHATFYKYIHPDPNKRRKIGNGERGKPKLISNESAMFIGEVCARQNRTNDGLSRIEIVDLLMEYEPSIASRKAASQLLTRVILPLNKEAGIFTGQLQKDRATTSDRIKIIFSQQNDNKDDSTRPCKDLRLTHNSSVRSNRSRGNRTSPSHHRNYVRQNRNDNPPAPNGSTNVTGVQSTPKESLRKDSFSSMSDHYSPRMPEPNREDCIKLYREITQVQSEMAANMEKYNKLVKRLDEWAQRLANKVEGLELAESNSKVK